MSKVPHDSPRNFTDRGIVESESTQFEINRQTKKQSLEYVWRSGLAGGLAGCAAKSVVAPLDRVKILFQASSPQYAKFSGSWFGAVEAMQDIYRQTGLRGLFKGHSATLLRIFPYASIKFLAYEQVRHVLIPSADYETASRRLLAGSLAGMTSVFFTYPLEMIRVRLAFETRNDPRAGLRRICKQIYSGRLAEMKASSPSKTPTSTPTGNSGMAIKNPGTAGLTNFYHGFSPTLLGMLPYAGVSFLTHDVITDFLRTEALAPYTRLRTAQVGLKSTKGDSQSSDSKIPLRSWAELFAGGVAGLVSQTAAYPLEVIRRRMQVRDTLDCNGRRSTIIGIGRQIWRERGWRGFFVGLGIGYAKVVPMVATSFLVYERGKLFLGI